MPQEKDQTAEIVEKIASIMSSHDLDLENLTNFISEHSQPITTKWTGIREHWDRRANQQKARREVLRLSLSDVPYEEISERVGRPLSGITRTITGERNKIYKAYRLDKNCLHDLADEYGLTTADIVSIYQDTQSKRAKKNERRLEHERRRVREWEGYLDSELERRKQERDSETPT